MEILWFSAVVGSDKLCDCFNAIANEDLKNEILVSNHEAGINDCILLLAGDNIVVKRVNQTDNSWDGWFSKMNMLEQGQWCREKCDSRWILWIMLLDKRLAWAWNWQHSLLTAENSRLLRVSRSFVQSYVSESTCSNLLGTEFVGNRKRPSGVINDERWSSGKARAPDEVIWESNKMVCWGCVSIFAAVYLVIIYKSKHQNSRQCPFSIYLTTYGPAAWAKSFHSNFDKPRKKP